MTSDGVNHDHSGSMGADSARWSRSDRRDDPCAEGGAGDQPYQFMASTVFGFEKLGAWASRQPDADGLVRDGAEQGDGEKAVDYEQRDHHGESTSEC